MDQPLRRQETMSAHRACERSEASLGMLQQQPPLACQENVLIRKTSERVSSINANWPRKPLPHLRPCGSVDSRVSYGPTSSHVSVSRPVMSAVTLLNSDPGFRQALRFDTEANLTPAQLSAHLHSSWSNLDMRVHRFLLSLSAEEGHAERCATVSIRHCG